MAFWRRYAAEPGSCAGSVMAAAYLLRMLIVKASQPNITKSTEVTTIHQPNTKSTPLYGATKLFYTLLFGGATYYVVINSVPVGCY